MNALVNGASGYIGYHLVKSLLNAGHRVFAVCRKRNARLEELKSDELIVIETGQDHLKANIFGLKIDVWYQLLWDGAVGEKRADVFLQEENVVMYLDALRVAVDAGCRKIIYTGTVYEHFTEDILNSEAENRHSFYILAKKQAHDLTLQMSKGMNIEYVWVQFCHPIGRFMNSKQLFPYAVSAFANDLPTSFGKCDRFFDVVPVAYLADALRILGEKKTAKKEYYIGSGVPRVLRDYLEAAAKSCEYSLPIGFGERPDDGLVFKREWFDTKAFEEETGLKCEMDYEKLVLELADLLKERAEV